MSTWNKNGLVDWIDKDTNVANVSVVFTWRLNDAYSRAAWYKQQGYAVQVGGPAVWSKPNYLQDVATIGVDYPDAIVHHNPNATVASRGCPVGCYFCIVPRMEGKEFTLLPNFTPRPILCDNNLSALPVDYQEYIVQRYQETNTPLLDANNGFEPKTFDSDCYHRWRKINKGRWRLGFDEIKEAEDVHRMLTILKDVTGPLKRVYVLIGNEPIASCYERIAKVIEWGAEPHVQPFIPQNAMTKHPKVAFDWNERKLYDMARWANKWIWRTVPITEYNPRTTGPNPFVGLV